MIDYDLELIFLASHFSDEIDKYFHYLDAHAPDNPIPFNEYYTEYIITKPMRRKYTSDKAEQCRVDGCSKTRAPNRSMCWMHKARRFKQINPHSYIWSKLKYNAKKRGIRFTLTKRFFLLFCLANNYTTLRGHKNNDYNIDRIDNSKGYERGNIQILTGEENLRKYHDHDKHQEKPHFTEEKEPLPF